MNSKPRPVPPERVGPKLRRYMLAKEWDAIVAEDRAGDGGSNG